MLILEENNNGLKIHINDTIETIKTLIERPPCNITSLLFFSDDINIRLPFKNDSKILSLCEKCLFIETNYSILSNHIRINRIKDILINIECSIDSDTIFDFDSNKKL